MSVFSMILCVFNRHKPLRRNVRWDGLNYVGECRRCGAPIERVRHNYWRKAERAPEKLTGDSV